MTDLLYHTDSYLRVFTATVIATHMDEGAVALDRTAFYPGGGGQPHDLGLIYVQDQPRRVTKVKRQGEHVWHWLDGPLPAVGTTVRGQLDWQRRYKLMRTHTALHVLCGVVWHDYGAPVTGGNMEPLKGRMDFEFATMRRELVQEIETRVNAEIDLEHAIRVQIVSREAAMQIPDLIRTKINLLPANITAVRTVEIVGLDLQADGGTHVANTSEVGQVRVVDYKSKGKINKRIHVALEE